MCWAMPCAGCHVCFDELRELVAANPQWRGPFIDPVTPEFGPYILIRQGLNSQGNYHETRRYGREYPNWNPYYYNNLNGSQYWSNPDGSTLYMYPGGNRRYTPPAGPPTPPSSPPMPRRAIPMPFILDDPRLLRYRDTASPGHIQEVNIKSEGSEDVVMYDYRKDCMDSVEDGSPNSSRSAVPFQHPDIIHDKGKGRAVPREPVINTSTSENRTVQQEAGVIPHPPRSQAPHHTPASPPTTPTRADAISTRHHSDAGVQTSEHIDVGRLPFQSAGGSRSRDIGPDDLIALTTQLRDTFRLSNGNVKPMQSQISGTVRSLDEMNCSPTPTLDDKRQRTTKKLSSRMTMGLNSQVVPRPHAPLPQRNPVQLASVSRGTATELPLQAMVTDLQNHIVEWLKHTPQGRIRQEGQRDLRYARASANYNSSRGPMRMNIDVVFEVSPIEESRD